MMVFVFALVLVLVLTKAATMIQSESGIRQSSTCVCSTEYLRVFLLSISLFLYTTHAGTCTSILSEYVPQAAAHVGTAPDLRGGIGLVARGSFDQSYSETTPL